MKKLLLIFALLLFSVAAISQTVSLVTVTVTNSTTKTQVYYDYQRTPIIVAPGATASYQVMAEIISGVPLSDVIPVIADTAEAIRTDYAEAVSAMLPIIADSTLWHLQGADTLVTDGALPIKVSGIRVSGTTRLDGTLTLITTAAESLIIGAGGFRNEGGLQQKGLAQFGATATPVYITADGKLGIGTSTSSPYNAFGLVSVASGRGTGIGLTSAQWNKNRTSWVTASDTSAISIYIDSAGCPRFSMKAVDGDTLGISLDGTETKFTATATYNLYVGGTLGFYCSSAGLQPNVNLNPYTNDVRSNGTPTYRWQNYFGTDGIFLYQKGQTPKLMIGVQNIYTEETDSIYVQTFLGGNPITKSFNGDGTAAINHYNTNGQMTSIKMATVSLTIGPVAAATDTCLNLIPAGSMVVGVTTRVTTAVTGDAGFTGFSVGDGSDVDRWGANLNPAAGETSDLTDCTITSAPIYNAATSIILTQVGGSTFATGGVVRVTVHYISLTAPTG